MQLLKNELLLKRIGLILAVLSVGVMAFWAVSGASFITQYQVATTQTVEDEFGDVIETTVMEDQFQFGLLPDRGYDGAAPIAGGFGGLAGLCFFFAWKRRKELARAGEVAHD